MSKKLTACCLGCLLTVVLLLSGCGGGNPASEPAVKPEAQSQTEVQTEVQTQVSTSSDQASGFGGGEVAGLLAKSKAIDEISFEYVAMEGKEEVAKGKAWVKGSRVKNEITADGETIISIYDTAKSEAYLYIAGEEMATLSELTPEMTGWFQTPSNFYDDLDVSFVKIVDTDIYDGHKCKIMVIANDQGQEESKIWVSEEYGIPLRIETNDAIGNVAIEYKNLKVGSVPDDAFGLPPGVEITDLRPPK